MPCADELTDRLARVVGQAAFQTGAGPTSCNEGEAHRRADSGNPFADAQSIDLDPGDLARLVDGLTPLFTDYTDEETGRIGNGLCLASLPRPGPSIEVSLESILATVEELARLLVVAAARITPKRVVELLTGWLEGEPLRLNERALIRGVSVVGAPRQRGITIETSLGPPPIVDHLLGDKPDDATDAEESECAVELEISPAIFKPRPGEDIDEVRERLVTTPRNASLGAVLSWDRLCESMALATPGYVGWDASWTDYGELEAFTGPVQCGVVSLERLRGVKGHPFTATALKFHQSTDNKVFYTTFPFQLLGWLRAARRGSRV